MRPFPWRLSLRSVLPLTQKTLKSFKQLPVLKQLFWCYASITTILGVFLKQIFSRNLSQCVSLLKVVSRIIYISFERYIMTSSPRLSISEPFVAIILINSLPSEYPPLVQSLLSKFDSLNSTQLYSLLQMEAVRTSSSGSSNTALSAVKNKGACKEESYLGSFQWTRLLTWSSRSSRQ